MNIIGRVPGFSWPRVGRQILVFMLSWSLLFATWPQNLPAQDMRAQAPGGQATPYTQHSSEQLQRLVAPIALYPDSLVAQILAASTFPEQVVEADRWVQAHPDLKGEALGRGVDQQPWDPSVKALVAFPAVLGNMDKNLSWTSSLGDAYYNQEEDLMDAVQVMRQRAEQSGNLRTTPQQTVTTEGSTVIIEPARPDVVYVPAYDPWVVYGDPIVAWPGWYPYPGIWFGGPYLSFGIGFGIGWFGGFGWGWGHWGFDWHNRYAIYNHDRYYSRSRTFYNRSTFYRDGERRGGVNNRSGTAARPFNGNRQATRGYAGPRAQGSVRSGAFSSGAAARPFNGNRQAARGYAEPRGQSSVRSGAFSGYGQGGQARGYSSRGSSSFVGGGVRSGGGARGGGGAPGGGGGARGGGGGARGGGGGARGGGGERR